MNLVFASNNIHKLAEIKALLGTVRQVLSPKDIGCFAEIPETGNTIEENASQKSFFIWNRYQTNCFADDTGLEIDALNGRPGVLSARYAGPLCFFEDNIRKVLNELNGISNRTARFRTVLSLILDGKEYLFEGRVEGTILSAKRGTDGFGYDPVFLPAGFSKTLAEMTLEEKNLISHRALAIQKMKTFLNSEFPNITGS